VRRPRRIGLVSLGIVAFLAVSFVVARFLITESDERDQVYSLLEAQARGDAARMLEHLDGCSSDRRCRAAVAVNARTLRRPGEVKILSYDSHTAYAFGSAIGPTRVAWAIADRGLPVVQCVTVRRSGTVLAARSVTLLRLSAPIAREGSC
jgi:hypothetical protein